MFHISVTRRRRITTENISPISQWLCSYCSLTFVLIPLQHTWFLTGRRGRAPTWHQSSFCRTRLFKGGQQTANWSCAILRKDGPLIRISCRLMTDAVRVLMEGVGVEFIKRQMSTQCFLKSWSCEDREGRDLLVCRPDATMQVKHWRLFIV